MARLRKNERERTQTKYSHRELEQSLSMIPRFSVILPSGQEETIIAVASLYSFLQLKRSASSALIGETLSENDYISENLVKKQHPDVNFGAIKNFIPLSKAPELLLRLQEGGYLREPLLIDVYDEFPITNTNSEASLPSQRTLEQIQQDEREEYKDFSLDNFTISNTAEFFQALDELGIDWHSLPSLMKDVQTSFAERNFLANEATELTDPEDLWKREHFQFFSDTEERAIFHLYAVSYLARKIHPQSNSDQGRMDPMFTDWEKCFKPETPDDSIRNLAHLVDHIETLVVFCNMGLILKNAKKFVFTYRDLPEYISLGKLAIYENMKRFNSTKGTKFSTYITNWILKWFRDYKHAESGIYFPRDYSTPMEKVKNYAAKHNLNPLSLTREKLKLLRISEELYETLRVLIKNSGEFISLDAPLKDSESTLQDILSIPADTDESDKLWDEVAAEDAPSLVEKMIWQCFGVNVSTLQKMETGEKFTKQEILGVVLILRHRLFERLSPQDLKDIRSETEVAEILGLSRGRVSQLEQEAKRYVKLHFDQTAAIKEMRLKKLR